MKKIRKGVVRMRFDPLAGFEQATLKNGLVVYAAKWRVPWEKIWIIVHAGARQDPVGKEGLAHYTEHVVSGNITSNLIKGGFVSDIEHFFERFGGEVRLGETWYQFSRYYFSSPIHERTIIKKFLDILGQMLFTAELRLKVRQEKKRIIKEFDDYYPPGELELQAKIMKTLFPNREIDGFVDELGTLKSLENISRKDLQGFYNQYYVPANISVVGIGGLSLGTLSRLLQASPFGLEKSGERVALAKPRVSVSKPKQTRIDFRVSDFMKILPESTRVSSYVAIPGIYSSYKLKIIVRMLDDVLFREISEKRGWTYNIEIDSVNLNSVYKFDIVCQSPWDRVEEVEKIIQKGIIEAFGSRSIIKHYLKSALADFYVIDLSAERLGEIVSEELGRSQRFTTYAEDYEAYSKLKVKDIQQLAEFFLNGSRLTVMRRR